MKFFFFSFCFAFIFGLVLFYPGVFGKTLKNTGSYDTAKRAKIQLVRYAQSFYLGSRFLAFFSFFWLLLCFACFAGSNFDLS